MGSSIWPLLTLHCTACYIMDTSLALYLQATVALLPVPFPRFDFISSMMCVLKENDMAPGIVAYPPQRKEGNVVIDAGCVHTHLVDGIEHDVVCNVMCNVYR